MDLNGQNPVEESPQGARDGLRTKHQISPCVVLSSNDLRTARSLSAWLSSHFMASTVPWNNHTFPSHKRIGFDASFRCCVSSVIVHTSDNWVFGFWRSPALTVVITLDLALKGEAGSYRLDDGNNLHHRSGSERFP